MKTEKIFNFLIIFLVIVFVLYVIYRLSKSKEKFNSELNRQTLGRTGKPIKNLQQNINTRSILGRTNMPQTTFGVTNTSGLQMQNSIQSNTRQFAGSKLNNVNNSRLIKMGKNIEKFENEVDCDNENNEILGISSDKDLYEIDELEKANGCTVCNTEIQVDDYIRRSLLNDSNVCGPNKKYTREELDNYRDNQLSFNDAINQTSHNDDMVDRVNEFYLSENTDPARNYAGIPIKDLFDGLVRDENMDSMYNCNIENHNVRGVNDPIMN